MFCRRTSLSPCCSAGDALQLCLEEVKDSVSLQHQCSIASSLSRCPQHSLMGIIETVIHIKKLFCCLCEGMDKQFVCFFISKNAHNFMLLLLQENHIVHALHDSKVTPI